MPASSRTARRLAGVVALLAATAAPSAATAQTSIALAASPLCAFLPAPCTVAQLVFTSPVEQSFDSFRFVNTGTGFSFADVNPFATTFTDATGLPGFVNATVGGPDGNELFLDFVGSGPAFVVGPAGTMATVDLEFAVLPPIGAAQITFAGALSGPTGGTVTGVVSTVPEPATVVLLGVGLLGVGAVARRRRAA